MVHFTKALVFIYRLMTIMENEDFQPVCKPTRENLSTGLEDENKGPSTGLIIGIVVVVVAGGGVFFLMKKKKK